MTQPVIIEVAINGATKKSKNPHVPISPAEIAADSIAVLEAGASIIHNHIDLGPCDGATAAARYREGWAPIHTKYPDALMYPTVNFDARGQALFDHIEPLSTSGPMRLGVVDPGSVNFGRLRDGVPSGGFVYSNSFDAIGAAFDQCTALGLGASIAIYEPGFLRATLAWWHAGRLPVGSMIKLYFAEDRGLTGAPFGLPATRKSLDAYLEMLEGCPVPWAFSLVGGDACASPVAAEALGLGGHLHVGLEFFGGERTPTNAELVHEAAVLCAKAGRTVATTAETIAILGLPAVRS